MITPTFRFFCLWYSTIVSSSYLTPPFARHPEFSNGCYSTTRNQVTGVVPQGFEPRLFWTKTRRVANYTIGQFVGRDGFEPPYPMGADLQSAGFNHSPTFQYSHASKDSNPDEWIWNPLCYQLHQRRV